MARTIDSVAQEALGALVMENIKLTVLLEAANERIQALEAKEDPTKDA